VTYYTVESSGNDPKRGFWVSSGVGLYELQYVNVVNPTETG